MENKNGKLQCIERQTPFASIENTFLNYYRQWINAVQFISSSAEQFKDANYKAIISMGWDVVPRIINLLREQPTRLFEALSEITGVHPEKPEHSGDLNEMAKDWIAWWDNYSNVKTR